MKHLILVLSLSLTALFNTACAQDMGSEFGKLILTPQIIEADKLPSESVSALIRKLDQIISKSGAVAREFGAGYLLTAEIGIGTRDFIAGPPKMMAQNIELALHVGDANKGISFSAITISLRGVGTNENKCLLEALKSISPGDSEIQECIQKGKAAIIEYYKSNCSKLIDEANNKAQLGQHDEAIYKLSLIPDACSECYSSALDACQMVYQAKVNLEGAQNLQAAKSEWSADPTETGAARASESLKKISPYSTSFEEAQRLSNSIRKKFEAQEEAEWSFKLKQYEDAMHLKREELRIAEEDAKRDDLSREERQKRQQELNKIRIVEYRVVANKYTINHLGNK